MNPTVFEKLDLFYLGKEKEEAAEGVQDVPFLYKSKDLTTHAAIIGMTGSGKTGLGIGLIEEATLDGIPSIIIDPKGDMSNLLLAFPGLEASEFQKWIDPRDAEQRGMTLESYAQKKAETWRQGLRDWGQDPDRIKTFREKAEFEIFTPGHTAGTSVSVLASFQAPGKEVLEDLPTLTGIINGTVSSLLALIGIQADPLTSREHILISSILLSSWNQSQDLTIEDLVGKIVAPEIKKIGVFPIDTFFPQEKRLELAMKLNNILASPSFSTWLNGKPLAVEEMLYTADGKPRVSIFSLAHLSDSERMFFVTLLLNAFVGWMRRQKGSSNLKAMLYMDEIFGFFPPSANPPSKKPMLLLLKQARAFGVGIVLATQNPVDLDYKGLSNMGTWFIGRLQTEQDQNRVLSGLSRGSAGDDEKRLRQVLSGLESRQFLCYSSKQSRTIAFQTRWVLSFLKGPLTLKEIEKLSSKTLPPPPPPSIPELQAVSTPKRKVSMGHPQPILSPYLGQVFESPDVPVETVHYRPILSAQATINYQNSTYLVQERKELYFEMELDESTSKIDWETAESSEHQPARVLDRPAEHAVFSPLPSCIQTLKSFKNEKKALTDHIYYNHSLTIPFQKDLKLFGAVHESPASFQMRVRDTLQERKEAAITKLKTSFEKRLDRIEDRILTAEHRVDKEKTDVQSKTMDTALSFGVAVLGALFGKRSRSTLTRSASGLRKAGRIVKEKDDVKRAREKLDDLIQDREGLIQELEEQIDLIHEAHHVDQFPITEKIIKLRRQDIFDLSVNLLWRPDLQIRP